MEIAYLLNLLKRKESMKKEVKGIEDTEEIKVTEKGAEACKDNEVKWLKEWRKEEGVEV